MISFKANLINHATVKRQGIDNKFHDKEVSFVQINPLSENDMRAINLVNLDWADGNTLARDIAKTINNCYCKYDISPKFKVFALTKQKDNFENLCAKDILALTQVRKQSPTQLFIDYLQVAPEYQYGREKRGFKKLGAALLNSVISHIPNKETFLKARESAIDFYKTQGFELTGKRTEMILKR